MSISYGPSINILGLELCLDAFSSESYSGAGSSWKDLSGNNYDATLLNGASFDFGNSRSMSFDGTNDYATVDYPSNNFINVNFTWSVWLKAISVGNENMPQIGYGSGSWPRLGFRGSQSNWYFSQFNISGPPNTTDILLGPQDANIWLNLVIVANYDTGFLTGYRNGALITTSSSYRDSTGNNGPLGLGRSGLTSWPDGVLLGNIGHFSIYNRALSYNEVLKNYFALKMRYTL